MAELDIFALGKTFQEIVSERGSALTDPFKEDFLAVTDQLLIRKQNLKQARLGFSGRSWMRNPTSSQRNYPKHEFITNTKITEIRQITQHQSHASNPSSYSHWLLNPFHPIHDIQPFLHWLGCSVPLLQCKSSRYEAHCMPSPAPSAVHVRMIAKIWQKGHTWGNHGYDTACIVNQMTVGSWIGLHSMTSRFISRPIPAAICVAQVWRSLYVFTFFFPQIYRSIWIIYLDLLWNFGVPSFPNKSRGLVERWLLWNLFEFVDIIHSGMSSLIFHLASPW